MTTTNPLVSLKGLKEGDRFRFVGEPEVWTVTGAYHGAGVKIERKTEEWPGVQATTVRPDEMVELA